MDSDLVPSSSTPPEATIALNVNGGNLTTAADEVVFYLREMQEIEEVTLYQTGYLIVGVVIGNQQLVSMSLRLS